jgi:anti-sigma B factor antagonist
MADCASTDWDRGGGGLVVQVAWSVGALDDWPPLYLNEREGVCMEAPGFSVVGAPGLLMLSGELDMATRPVLDQAIAQAVAQGGVIVLDVSAVTFMDSTGIHAILDTVLARASGCTILHGVHGSVARVLEVSGLGSDPRLHIVECRE